jgi:acyl carrier protein
MKKEDIENIILQAIETLNKQQPESNQLEISRNTELMGSNSPLDSFGLVTLIVEVEQGISDLLDIEITLADEHSMSQRRSPFRSVDSLADYILLRLEKYDHE